MTKKRFPILGGAALISGMIVIGIWMSYPEALPGTGECDRDPDKTEAGAAGILSRLPLAFVENRGQWDEDVLFMARRSNTCAAFSSRSVFLTRERRDRNRLRGVTVRLTFEDSSDRTRLVGVDPLPGVSNFFIGNDRSRWKIDVPGYRQVHYQGLYDGVAIRFREQDGKLEYDVELAPGADPGRVVIACEGSRSLTLDDSGTLLIHTAVGTLRQRPPTTWQVLSSGKRKPILCRYRILSKHRYGFTVPAHEPALALVIDPGLEWSTYLGGSRYEFATDVAVDANSVVTLCGQTQSSNFPIRTGSYDTRLSGNADAFVTRLNAAGSALLFSTYLGGSGIEYARAIAVSTTGEIVVAGHTDSSNFPTTSGAYSRNIQGSEDVFVTRLNASGSALLFSTYLGGTSIDQAFDVALDSTGGAAVVGMTKSSNFPTTAGAYDRSFNGGEDAFVARLNSTGSQLVSSTFLGGTGKDSAISLALDATGTMVVAGQAGGINNNTTSDFPTTPGAYDTTYNGGSTDTYVARINAAGSTLMYSTFLGGPKWDPARGVSLAPGGEATVVGQTYSSSFPTTPGAFDTTYGGEGDVFVARLNSTGSSLQYGTFIGGTDYDNGTALALDSSGAMTVAGWTRSLDFPTTPGAFQTTGHANGNGFVTRLMPAGATAAYSTYFGGTSWDAAYGVALDITNGATLAGETWSSGFPTTPGAVDTSYNTNGDVFVTRLDVLPTGVTRFGASTPSSLGPVALGVTRMPTAGSASFAVTCINAPPNTAGILAVGTVPSLNGIPLANIKVHINPYVPFIPFFAASNGKGASTVNLAIPAGIRGVKVYCQIAWSNTLTHPGSGILSASNALELTIQ